MRHRQPERHRARSHPARLGPAVGAAPAVDLATCGRHDAGPVDNSWIMLEGRPFFVAGFTPGGAAYGIYEDEMELCDDSPF